MTKEEARQRLKKLGYNVVDDSSVVTVVIGRDTSFKTALNDVKKKLKELGYNASFSVRQLKDGDVLAESDGSDDSAIADDVDFASENESDTMIDDEASTDADSSILSNTSSEEPEDNPAETKEDKDSDADNTSSEDDEPEFFDEEDMDMILTEDAVQFSLDDFGLSF